MYNVGYLSILTLLSVIALLATLQYHQYASRPHQVDLPSSAQVETGDSSNIDPTISVEKAVSGQTLQTEPEPDKPLDVHGVASSNIQIVADSENPTAPTDRNRVQELGQPTSEQRTQYMSKNKVETVKQPTAGTEIIHQQSTTPVNRAVQPAPSANIILQQPIETKDEVVHPTAGTYVAQNSVVQTTTPTKTEDKVARPTAGTFITQKNFHAKYYSNQD